MLKYYTYELKIVPGDKVCYVGKGQGNRLNYHHWLASKMVKLGIRVGRSSTLYDSLAGVLRCGKDFKAVKVFEYVDEEAALTEENRRIELYGIDNLFNILPHGWKSATDAVSSGLIKRAKLFREQHGYGISVEAMRKLKARIADNFARYGMGIKPETRIKYLAKAKKRKESLGGKYQTPETRKKISSSRTGKRYPWVESHRLAVTKRRSDKARLSAFITTLPQLQLRLSLNLLRKLEQAGRLVEAKQIIDTTPLWTVAEKKVKALVRKAQPTTV